MPASSGKRGLLTLPMAANARERIVATMSCILGVASRVKLIPKRYLSSLWEIMESSFDRFFNINTQK
jgi:hypothetical protein